MKLLDRIEKHLKDNHISATRFGRRAVGDPRFVLDLRMGRRPRRRTIERLNADQSQTRDSVKLSVASLTIGSASAAMVLCDAELSRKRNQITTAVCRSATAGHELCQSVGLAEVMQTDSETLMRQGVDVGAATFAQLREESGWSVDDIDKTFCHQVGSAHRKMMLDRLGVAPAIDFPTFEWLGNTGSAALPAALCLGRQEGWLDADDRVALLGIGSGINCLMMGVHWQESRSGARRDAAQPSAKPHASAGTRASV